MILIKKTKFIDIGNAWGSKFVDRPHLKHLKHVEQAKKQKFIDLVFFEKRYISYRDFAAKIEKYHFFKCRYSIVILT